MMKSAVPILVDTTQPFALLSLFSQPRRHEHHRTLWIDLQSIIGLTQGDRQPTKTDNNLELTRETKAPHILGTTQQQAEGD